MSFGDQNPTFDELMEVVEKQQEVIEICEQQMEASRMESRKLAEEGEKKSEIIRILEEAGDLLRAEIDALKSENKQLEQRKKEEKDGKGTESELGTVGEMRMRCKELNYELERLKTRQSSLEVELETEKKNHGFARSELEEEKRLRSEEKKQANEAIESMRTEMRENWHKQQETLSTNQMEIARMRTELEIKEQREKQLERHYEDIMDEITETRKEKASAMARNTAMSAENAELRAKIQQLRVKLPRSEHDLEDMSKLLADQSHLISALREEVKLLARKLESDARDHRQSIKVLRHEKRELEARIENFLHVE
ncbi:unnamed protein product [Caenorhabditis sp. 36 PRJEB53466]|nr:unnamed protein product [Caenorhabditis sp. 36 PRJEB53466]